MVLFYNCAIIWTGAWWVTAPLLYWLDQPVTARQLGVMRYRHYWQIRENNLLPRICILYTELGNYRVQCLLNRGNGSPNPVAQFANLLAQCIIHRHGFTQIRFFLLLLLFIIIRGAGWGGPKEINTISIVSRTPKISLTGSIRDHMVCSQSSLPLFCFRRTLWCHSEDDLWLFRPRCFIVLFY